MQESLAPLELRKHSTKKSPAKSNGVFLFSVSFCLVAASLQLPTNSLIAAELSDAKAPYS